MHSEIRELRQEVDALLKSGEFDEALSVANVAAERARSAWGLDSLDYAVALTAIGAVHSARGAYAAALPFYEKATHTMTTIHGAGAACTVQCLNELANNYLLSRRLEDASRAVAAELGGAEACAGRDSYLYAEALSNLATLHQMRHEFSEAEAVCRRSLQLRVLHFGKESEEFAWGLSHLATMLLLLGRVGPAIRCLKRCIWIHEHATWINDALFAVALRELGVAYQDSGDIYGATALCRQALEVLTRIAGVSHPEADLLRARLRTLQKLEG